MGTTSLLLWELVLVFLAREQFSYAEEGWQLGKI